MIHCKWLIPVEKKNACMDVLIIAEQHGRGEERRKKRNKN